MDQIKKKYWEEIWRILDEQERVVIEQLGPAFKELVVEAEAEGRG